MASREHNRRARKSYCIDFLRRHGYEVRELPEEFPDHRRRKSSRWACRLINTADMIGKVRNYILVNCTSDIAKSRYLRSLDAQERGKSASILFGWHPIGKDWYANNLDWRKLYALAKEHESKHGDDEMFILEMR